MENSGLPVRVGSLPERRAAAPSSGRPRFLVLGLLAITDGHETVVLQPSRPSALLAALLLHPGAVVGSDFLQHVVWGDHPPSGGKSALHTCVLRLRRLFAKYGVADHAIEAVPGGYRLHADEETLDLLQFRGLIARADVSDDSAQALRFARQALELWKEPLLANVHSDELHRDQIRYLAEERLLAVQRVFDGELRLGRHREIIAEARQAVRANPSHEGLAALFIEALHRSGRRAEALAEYSRIRNHLAGEVGVEPGAALRGLQRIVLSGDAPALTAGQPTTLARAPAPGGFVLRSLVDAGLLEEGPPGRYRVHDLLHAFVQAAGTRLPGVQPHDPADPPPPTAR